MKKLFSIFICAILIAPLTLFASNGFAESANLIANASVETATGSQPVNWTSGNWGSNTASFSYANTGHTGTKSLKATVTNYSSGDAKWTADWVSVTPGQTYTYSDYSTASVDTEIDIAYQTASGEITYDYLAWVNAHDSWQQSSTTFTVPANVTKVSVMHLIANNGWLQTDDFSLTLNEVTTPVESTTNLLANGSFETANGSDPSSWRRGGWGTNTATLTYPSGDAHTGNRSVRATISSYTTGDVKWYATPIAVTAGQTYTYSDYYKSGVSTSIVAALTNASGEDSYLDVAVTPASGSWAQYTGAITIPSGIQSITIYHLIKAVGTLDIDDAVLTANATTPTVPSTNYVANNSFEMANGSNPASWTADNWGSNTASFSYVNGDAHTGTRSAKVTVSNYQNGDAKWRATAMTGLTPGAQYTYSIWYKTTIQPAIVAQYTDAQGVNHYSNLPAANPDVNAATAWQQYSTNVQVSSDAVSMSILFIINSNGWLQTDDASFTSLVNTGFNEALLSLTFDDGWLSVYDNALPVLKKYGFVSTQYIISGSLNQPYYMTTAQLQAFQNAGHEIGSHTVNHPDLTEVTNTQLLLELGNSKTRLQQLFGADVAQSFASPYGSYNESVITATKQYYQSHRSVDVGYNAKTTFNAYAIVVQNMTMQTTTAEVASWVAKAQADQSWLVIVYHSVTPAGDFDEFTVSTANLDAQLSAIQNAGIAVKTVKQALAEITPQLSR